MRRPFLPATAVAAVAAAAVLAGACSETESADSPSRTPVPTDAIESPSRPDTPTESPSESQGPSASPSTSPPIEVTTSVVGEGFDNPVQILPSPTGETLVIEQAGRVSTLSGDVVLDVSDRVRYRREQGLLGAAFAVDGSGEEKLFLHYSGDEGATTVSSFAWPDPASSDETVLYTVAQPASNHNGGSILLGPDGMLYLALGDGGAGNDRFGNGQRTDTPLGAILRFDVRASSDELVAAPDNPFTEGGDPAVWAYGLRNPWRIWFTDERVWVADVGQGAREEISVVDRAAAAGGNFGWPRMEGTICREDCSDELIRPVVEHDHGEEPVCAIIGGVVYEGSAIPGLRGHYLYGDACAGFLNTVRPDGSGPGPSLTDQVGSLRGTLGFGIDGAGEVYIGLSDGRVLRLDPR